MNTHTHTNNKENTNNKPKKKHIYKENTTRYIKVHKYSHGANYSNTWDIRCKKKVLYCYVNLTQN
jgi:hypothetical protein